MAAQGYYGGDQSWGGQQYNDQGNYQQDPSQQHQPRPADDQYQTHDRSNPYGYPESGAPQSYYGHDGTAQQPAYDAQQYQSYGLPQNQDHGSYNNQSYNTYEQQQYPPAYNASYPPQEEYENYQQPNSHDQFANAYDNSRQQDYDYYNQQQNQYVQAPLAVPFQEIRADPNLPPTGPVPNPNGTIPVEGERGLMGALAGGAMGAYGGHQMGHGIIGVVGGAYAGHKLEDAVKDKRKEKKKHKKHHSHSGSHGEGRRRRGSHSSSSSSSSSSSDSDSGKDKKTRKHKGDKYAVTGAGAYAAGYGHGQNSSQGRVGNYAGNFSAMASSITLDRDYDLIALCRDSRGKEKLSSIKLNDYLANEWGRFKWAKGGNAFASARNVRLSANGRVLEAELGDGRGGWSSSRLVLDERIGNDDGELVFRD